MFKLGLGKLFLIIHGVTFVYAAWMVISGLLLPSLGLLIIAFGPLLQWLAEVDTVYVPYHKVRLPGISVLVLAGLALILVTVDRDSEIIWLGFLNVGAFLLATYWLRD